MENPQTFANHTRWHPLFHFFLLPVMLINFVWAIVDFVKAPTPNSGWWIVVSVALVLLTFLARTYALKVQDRVIRLEESLRYRQILSPAVAQKAAALTTSQVIALRFAGDDELEALIAQTLAGQFETRKDIKRAITNWRADSFRV